MIYYETVHEETRDGFDIVLSFAPEHYAPDWDMTEEEKVDLFDRIDRGVLLWFMARVEVKKAGITLGSDYLGGCCYESVLDFMRGGYYDDMIDAAMREARKTILELVAA
jgi:hypothetical protein